MLKVVCLATPDGDDEEAVAATKLRAEMAIKDVLLQLVCAGEVPNLLPINAVGLWEGNLVCVYNTVIQGGDASERILSETACKNVTTKMLLTIEALASVSVPASVCASVGVSLSVDEHARVGILHGAIKPEHLVYKSQGEKDDDPTVYLLNFEEAHIGSSSASVCVPARVSKYHAPEAVAPGAEWGVMADVYGLGKVMFKGAGEEKGVDGWKKAGFVNTGRLFLDALMSVVPEEQPCAHVFFPFFCFLGVDERGKA